MWKSNNFVVLDSCEGTIGFRWSWLFIQTNKIEWTDGNWSMFYLIIGNYKNYTWEKNMFFDANKIYNEQWMLNGLMKN